MKFEKPKRPIDFLPKNPNKAIWKAWQGDGLNYTLEELETWFYTAIRSPSCIYNENKERAAFVAFYFDFRIFIEAMFFYYLPTDKEREERYKKVSYDTKEWMDEQTFSHRLSQEQEANPMPVIKNFCKSYSLLYVRIELWDFFEAVLDGAIINLNLYLNLLTLAEAAYIITDGKAK